MEDTIVNEKEKGYWIIHLNIVTRIALIYSVLGATIIGAGAETIFIEVPSWDIKNESNNPVNADSLTIVKSQIGILVPSTVVVKGYLSHKLEENHYLWIAVKPYKSIENWWPQTGGPLPIMENRTFEGNAFLGGTNGDLFEIGLLIVGDEINSKFLDWLNYSKNVDKWPPISEGHQGADHKVSKEEIENHKYASVTVILKEE